MPGPIDRACLCASMLMAACKEGASLDKGSGRIFLLVGPSGAGKNTLIEAVLRQEDGLRFIPSVTTRSKRPNEVEGRSYIFTTEEDFLRRLQQGGLLEHQRVHGHLYGTSREHLFAPLAEGACAITDIDILGAFKVKALYPDLVTVVFILVPSLGLLEQRILERGAVSAAELSLRLARVLMELSLSYACDAFVVNEEVNAAAAALRRVINAARNNPSPPAQVLQAEIPPLRKQFRVALARGEQVPMALERGLRAAWWEDHPGATWFDLPPYTVGSQPDGTWQVRLTGEDPSW